MSEIKCKNCSFFDWHSKASGFCRRNAPSPNQQLEYQKTEWPSVLDSDWCGEFRDIASRLQESEKSVCHKPETTPVSFIKAGAEVGIPSLAQPPMSLDKFMDRTGLCAATCWRYRNKGWLRTILIAGRHYVSHQEIEEFNRRAASGEFAGAKPANPSKFSKRPSGSRRN